MSAAKTSIALCPSTACDTASHSCFCCSVTGLLLAAYAALIAVSPAVTPTSGLWATWGLVELHVLTVTICVSEPIDPCLRALPPITNMSAIGLHWKSRQQ